MMIKQIYLFTVFAALPATTFAAEAIDCATLPKCAEYGYDKDIGDCATSWALRCPFDKQKAHCGTDCEVGDILFSDGKCHHIAPVMPKVAIGIVFDTDNRLAVSLDRLENEENAPETILWGTKDQHAKRNCAEDAVRFSCRTDGLLNAIDAPEEWELVKYYYSSSGSITTFVPSVKEMYMLYQKRTLIYPSVKLYGEELKDAFYWTSNLADGNETNSMNYGYTSSAWAINPITGEIKSVFVTHPKVKLRTMIKY